MLERVRLFAVHCSAHLTFYTVPRLLYALFVRLPVTLWELLTFRRPFTFSFRREREIKVVTSATDPAASQQLLDKLGLSRSMTYMDPMYSGHIHTVLGAARISNRVRYERELFDAPDGNPISLDWLYVPKDRESHTKGILLVVPGLGNYGQTPYIQRLARHCVANDFHCCVLTPRGMGSAPLKVPHLTCATFTKDLRCTLRQRLHKDNLEKRFGFRLPLFLLGYSAGATTSLKFLAEEEGRLLSAYPGGFPVTACVVMSAPYDFTTYAASMALPLAKVLYQPVMLSSLRKYTIKHREVFTNGIPGVSADMESLPRLVRSLKSVQDFEERIVGPHFDYGNAAGYYADGYAPQWVRKIKAVPVVCAAARDDPVTGYGITAADWQVLCNESPNVVYVETPVGGHLGYMAGPLDEYRGASSFLYSFPVLVMASAVR